MRGETAFGAYVRDITDRRRAQSEQLRRTEEPFRALLDGVTDYAIFMLDREGRVASWNTDAERITGYRAEEIMGEPASRFYPEDDVRAGKLARALAEAERAGRSEEEGWRVRKDGTRYPARSSSARSMTPRATCAATPR